MLRATSSFVRSTLLASLALLPAASFAAADCSRDGIQVFPSSGSVIPVNTRIVLEGVGAEQDRVSALIGRELTLKAEDDTVTVKVLKGWKSAQNKVAVLLRPRAWLKPNRIYKLMLDQPLSSFTLLPDRSSDLPEWRTGKGPDERTPRWVDKPAVSEGRYTADRNGELTAYLKFRLSLQEESPTYLVFSIRLARGNTPPQVYFAPVSGGEALVGHDACSGNFDFEDGRAYRATIEAYDSAGNLAPPIPAIEFQAPKRIGR